MKKFGFFGVGKIALHHLKVLKEQGHIVPFACSKSPESNSWKSFLRISKNTLFEPSPIKLLSNYDLDGIFICLPWNQTEKYIELILKSKMPVLIEKPAALSSEKLNHAIINNKKYLNNKWVGYNRRFYKTVENLKKRINKGGLKVVNICISEDIQNHIKKHGYDIIPHLLEFSSSHILDLLFFLFRKVKIVKLFKYNQTFNGENFQSVNGILKSNENIPIFLQINSNDPSSAGIFCKFDDNTHWSLSPLEKLTIYDKYKVIEEKNNNIRQYVPSISKQVYEDNEFKPGFEKQILEFINLNSNNKLPNMKDQLKVLNFIKKIKQ